MANSKNGISRRGLLKGGAALAVAGNLPLQGAWARGEGTVAAHELVAGVHRVRFADAPYPETEVWAFGGRTPGPVLRLPKGRPSHIRVRNQLPAPTTVHWHGLRIANAMDGVPAITQPPIEPGDDFDYVFTPPDAGTFWYHSHFDTAVQVGRGVYGLLIVEEDEPLSVDRDEYWVLDDWRLGGDGQIVGDFDNPRDLARAGRLGNTVTVNGRLPGDFPVRAGERIRLRLLNGANARIFQLRFRGHQPLLIARDGHPMEPRPIDALELGPAQRADLVLDMVGNPRAAYRVLDTYFPQAPMEIGRLVYGPEPLRRLPPEDPVALPHADIPEPDLSQPQREVVNLAGGDLGNLDRAWVKGELLEKAELYIRGKMWAMNGAAQWCSELGGLRPIFTVERGRTVDITFRNHSAWPHPMHLHGHSFKVIEHPGKPDQEGIWLDTVVVGPQETVRVAFVADNPGDWLFHCHILGHARAGMLTLVSVS